MNKCIDGDNEKGLLCPIMHFSLKTHKDNAASQAYWQNPIQSFSHSLCIIYTTQCCNRLLCTYLLLLSASACVGKFMFLIGHIDIPTRPIKLSRPTTRKGKVCFKTHGREKDTENRREESGSQPKGEFDHRGNLVKMSRAPCDAVRSRALPPLM